MWEHERNKNGGRLVILFKRGGTGKDPYTRDLKMIEDKLWLEIVSVSVRRSVCDLCELFW